MAIKIIGTDVINNQRQLVNITDATITAGDSYSAKTHVITNNINFTQPFSTCTLTAATTFTVSGDAEGKSAILILDTSTTPYTPSWPSAINWEDNTEPTWSTYRKWQIHFYCVSGTRIDAFAIGFDALSSQPTEAITLEGTSGSPEAFYDMAGSNANDMVMGWRFGSDGNVYKYESIYNVGGNGLYLYSSSTWNNITPSQTYYIRVTNFGGTKNLSTPDSDTLNSWIALSSNRDFRIRDSRDLLSYADENMVMKVEIASDSGGSNILDTGYYECEYSGLA
jgi:hypothetical protein